MNRLEAATEQFKEVVSSLSLSWKRRLWTILIWTFGIPLSTIGFLTILFWAYGAND